MSYKNIVFEHLEDGIATITISRPEKLNAMNRETMGELETAFEYVQYEPTIRGLIVTGAGEKAFVAGADIHELRELRAVEASRHSAVGQNVFRRLELMGKPSIAAINGFALGAGLELAMACTLRVAVAICKPRAAGTKTRIDTWIRRDSTIAATRRSRQGAGIDADGRKDRGRRGAPDRLGESSASARSFAGRSA